MPNITFDSLDQVPDEFKAIAKAVEGSDGKVTINVVPKTTVDEFRDKNIALSKERDGLVEKVTALGSIVGDDPEVFTKSLEEMRATTQRVKDGELKETRQIEEALAKRTDEMRKDYERQIQVVGKDLAAWRTKHDAVDVNYKRALVASTIKDACVASESGVEPKAIDDIISYGHNTWRVDDHGRVTPFDGDAPMIGSDGVNSLSPKEWLAKLKEVKPFFFKPTQGGGSGGESSTTRKIMGVDRSKIANMTPMQKLELANEETARRTARTGQ